MLQCLLSLIPVLLFDLDFRLHQHEYWILSYREILGKSLLEILVCGFVLTCLAIDKRCENMGLDNSAVFLQTVIDLSQSPWGVIEEPSGLGKQYLCLC